MKHIPLESSVFASYAYSRREMVLELAFHSGETWRYKGVRPEHLAAFLLAPSKGTHFHKFIRGKYDGEKVTAGETPTGGIFTLTVAGRTTSAIPYDATAARVQQALDAAFSRDTDR